MTSTQFFNWLHNGICAAFAVGAELLADPNFVGAFPPKYAHAVSTAALIAIVAKSRKNLTINPDGTPANVAYQKPQETK